jgi:hypothetical protein
MDTLTAQGLKELLEHTGRWCVSISTPTCPTWSPQRTDQLRFQEQTRAAGEQLLALGLRSPEVRDLLGPVQALTQDAGFWREQAEGLVVFASGELFRHYRLPVTVPELLMVAQRFAIRPLLPVLGEDLAFYVLALTQQDVRLLRCTRDVALEVELPELPRDVREATGYDEPERGFTTHAGTPTGAGGRPAAMVHTTGVRADDRKGDILEYCQQIDRRLRPLLEGRTAPMVLAGVEFLLSIHRQASTYPHLLDGVVPGSTNRLDDGELRRRAWPLVEAELSRARDEELARYRQSIGTGRASADLRQVLRAAYAGQVGTLFFVENGPVWGCFDPASGTLEVHEEPRPGDEDLVDAAVAGTARHRGSVFTVGEDALDGESRVAALFRYDVAM